MTAGSWLHGFGEPAVSYDITVYVKENGRQALFTAEDELSLLKRLRWVTGSITAGLPNCRDFDRISGSISKLDHPCKRGGRMRNVPT